MNIKPSFTPMPRFAGTGVDGKPRVLVAKADYRLHEVSELSKRPEIECEGFATSGDEFIERLEATNPDVVVVGSTFGDFSGLRPLMALRQYLSQHPDKKAPGVVVHSMFPINVVDAMGRNTGDDQIKYRHTSNKCSTDELVQRIQDVDPYPVQK